MSFYQASLLCAAIFHGLLAVFILSRDLRAVLNRVYFLWGMCLTAWNLGGFMVEQVARGDESRALFWVRVLHLGVVFAPVSICNLCFLIARVSRPRLLAAFYLLSVLLALMVFTPWYIADLVWIERPPLGYFSLVGPAFYIYIGLYVAIAAITFRMLYLKQKSLAYLHRTRLRALLLAYVTLAFFGGNDMMPLFGRYQYPGTTLDYYPTGGVASLVFGVIVVYSVLQHHLLDIHLRLSRAASYLVQIAFSIVCSLLLLALLRLVFPQQLSGWVFLGALAVVVVNSLVTSLIFPSFFGRGSDALERRILGDRFAYHEHLRSYTQRVRAHPNPESMVPELHDLFTGSVGMKSFQIIMRDETTQTFTLVHSHPDRLLGPLPSLDRDSPLFRFFQGAHPGYLALKIAYSMPGETQLEHEARKQLTEFDPEFCFPLFYEQQLFGLLLVGPKSSEDPYTPQDLHLLVDLARNLSLLLNQVRLKNQIVAAQEQELLGRMSRGLAHDLNNLITPAQTFLQLCAQGLMNQEAIEELLPVAMRNVDTIRSYINEALFFSRTHRLEVRPARVDEIIRAAVDLMEPRARAKAIEFRIEGLAPTLIEVDEVMIQRLLGNLLSNAIDASPPRGAVHIQLTRLPRTETHRDWVRVKVVDFGSGISRENLERVFTPYFTTKDRGDGNRGFGLGLAIARKIVHLHGGNLRIASVEKKGTTVEVDLPSRHLRTGPDGRKQSMTATVRS